MHRERVCGLSSNYFVDPGADEWNNSVLQCRLPAAAFHQESDERVSETSRENSGTDTIFSTWPYICPRRHTPGDDAALDGASIVRV